MLNSLYWAIDPVIFTIGPLSVRWYGVAYLLGFVCCAIIMMLVARRWKINFSIDVLLEVMLCGMIGIILGARLGHVVFYDAAYYANHLTEIFAFSNGGMSFHGGLIGGVLGLVVASKLVKMPFLTLGDLALIGAPVGLFFGRVANFINGELWGAPTDLPWGVMFGGEAGMIYRHPSQLYEALLEGLVIFVVMIILARKKPPLSRGMYSGIFMVMYAVFRVCIEFVRIPESQQGYLAGDWFTMGMLLSIPLLIAGVYLIVRAIKKCEPQAGVREA